MKKVWPLVVFAMLLVFSVGGVTSVSAAGGGGSAQVGPVTIVEPIVPQWDLRGAPSPNSSVEPGYFFTVSVTATNISKTHGYWVQFVNIGWGTNAGVQPTVYFFGQDEKGNAVAGPVLINPGESRTVKITVGIRESSPATSGITFFFNNPFRVDSPEKG